MGPIKAFSVLIEEAVSVGAMIATNLPALLALTAVLSVILAFSATAVKVDEFLNLQQKIKEYTLVLKNLEHRTKAARVECLEQDNGKTGLRISG